MNFEDEPVPGYPLPILPGHTSPGRLERLLRKGVFAVTSELDPPDSADPDDVSEPAACVACRGLIPAGESWCPQCGWSYTAP